MNYDLRTGDRRSFLKSVVIGGIGISAAAKPTDAQSTRVSANDQVRIGVVGLGSRGFNLLDAFLAHSDAVVTAICDVDSFHYRDRPWGSGRPMGLNAAESVVNEAQQSSSGRGQRRGVMATSDFRAVCESDQVDAVVVATPDHWHALCTLTALRAGKDVYCEKPVTHTFAEGQVVYREVARRNAVFQTGSQQRSASEFQLAVELARNGHLGTINRIEVGLPPGYERPQGATTVTDVPEHLDYDQWCGPAQVLPYMQARHHRWWRGHRAYGGGVLMDWIGHHNDIAHWAIGVEESGPQQVQALNWTMPDTDIYNTPRQYTIRSRYANGTVIEVASHHKIGVRLFGERGTVYVTRGKIEASNRDWLKPQFALGDWRIKSSVSHTQNFLDCVRSRAACIAPAESAHRSITPGHLAYVSHALGRPLEWDPVAETIIGDAAANRLLRAHSYREPWSLNGVS